MSRLKLTTHSPLQTTINRLRNTAARRLSFNPLDVCPVETTRHLLGLFASQTCGKCSPCRIGLAQMVDLLDQVLEGNSNLDLITVLEKTAGVVESTADCALGIEASRVILEGLKGFRKDFVAHILTGRCLHAVQTPVPCIAECPAHVDIPGYIALINSGRYNEAVQLICKDNPFPTACGYVCEHPCESKCRRGMVDAPLNIRALKRYAVDKADSVKKAGCAPSTGKKVAVIGGGPCGLSAAYFLSLMGHKVTVFEKYSRLGGMIRYGIPDYRYPRHLLDQEINSILSLGITTQLGVEVGVDVSYETLRRDYDAVFIAIGAHKAKLLNCEGEDAKGVLSAVKLLSEVGDGKKPDFSGKKVVVIGGGNVAMDCTRSAIRFGAEKVTCVYRRREEDMTALPEEIEGAVAEGAVLTTLHSPVRIETNERGEAVALWIQPQIIGKYGDDGRPKPLKADAPEVRVPADVVLTAIGQDVESSFLAQTGALAARGRINADEETTSVANLPGVFAGGDCATGPETVIKAIAAGKTAAANIDEYLGFNHKISTDIDIPRARPYDVVSCGRVNVLEREACERKCDSGCIEIRMSDQEARYESSRCLRCDHFGYGSFRKGREQQW